VNHAFGRGRLRVAVAAALLALSLMASMVVAQGAEARSLSSKQALKTATKLVKQQISKRKLVEARISVGKRINRNRIQFLYDDLNRSGVVCTGTINVRLLSNRVVRALFIGPKCAAPGTEALAYRTVTRAAGRAFLQVEAAMRRSITRYTENAQACETLNVPANKTEDAALLLSTGFSTAALRPLDSVLNDYATTLQSLGVVDPQLAKGAAAWRDFVDGARSLPRFSPGACSVLAKWAQNGYSDATAPTDFAALRALHARLAADGAEVRRTSRYLAKLGIDPVTAVEFSLGDLIGATSVAPSVTPAQAAQRLLAR
jgi:hypothetical protein